jgi:hypothetical protein
VTETVAEDDRGDDAGSRRPGAAILGAFLDLVRQALEQAPEPVLRQGTAAWGGGGEIRYALCVRAGLPGGGRPGGAGPRGRRARRGGGPS